MSKITINLPNRDLELAVRRTGTSTQLLWEIPGPKDTAITHISCFMFGKTIAIVHTYEISWEAYFPIPYKPNDMPHERIQDMVEYIVANAS